MPNKLLAKAPPSIAPLPVYDYHSAQPVYSLVLEVRVVPMGSARARLEPVGESLSRGNRALGDVTHPVHPGRTPLVHAVEMQCGAL